MKTASNLFSHGLLLIAAALICFSTGCGKDYGVELHPATGTVTMDGQPLPDATIEFRPIRSGAGQQSAPRGAIGFTNELGEYKLLFRDTQGCPAGDFKVIISTYSEPTGADPDDRGNPETVPDQYRAAKSSLKATITEDGDNAFNFDLKFEGN